MDFRNHHSNKRFFLMKQMNDYKKKVSKDNERKQNEVSQKDLTLDEWKAWKQDNDRMMEAKESDTNETLTQIKYEEWRLEEERKEKERLEKEKIAREIEVKKKAEEAKREQERIRIEKMEERKKQIALKRLEEQREKERVEKERARMDKEDKETKDKIRQEKEIIRKEKYEAHKRLMAKKKEAMEIERARANHERQLMTEEDNTGKAIVRKEKERIWRIKKEEWRKQKAIEHRERMKKQHELMVKHREEKRLRKRQKVSFQLNSFAGSVPKPVVPAHTRPLIQEIEEDIADIFIKNIIVVSTPVIKDNHDIEHHMRSLGFNVNTIYHYPKDINNKTIYIFLYFYPTIRHHRYPKYYIIWQIEQLCATNQVMNALTQEKIKIMNGALQIYEISMKHYNTIYSEQIPRNKIYYCPLPFYHVDQNADMNPDVEKDLDCVFIGANNARRHHILTCLREELEKRNITLHVYHGIFGDEKIDILKRAKYILNIHYYDNASLETHRINEALHYNCITISEDVVDESDDSTKNTYANTVLFNPIIEEGDTHLDIYVDSIEANLKAETYHENMESIHIHKETLSEHFSKLMKENAFACDKLIDLNSNIGIVITTHGNNGIYAKQCLECFIRNVPNAFITFYVNESNDPQTLNIENDYPNIHYIYNKDQTKSGGLTGTWNEGISLCVQNNCGVIILSNDDIFFDKSIKYIIQEAFLCKNTELKYFGPVSNNPGPSEANKKMQHSLHSIHKPPYTCVFKNQNVNLNGFFMVFPVHVLKQNMYDKKHYFDPNKPFGGNEVEWFNRFKEKNGTSVIVPRTFIYHYKLQTWRNKQQNDSCIYTINFGNYEKNAILLKQNTDVDNIYFTDNPNMEEQSQIYNCIENNIIFFYVNTENYCSNNWWTVGKHVQRMIKTCPHDYLPYHYKKSLYIDGNIHLKRGIFKTDIDDFLENHDIICFDHPEPNINNRHSVEVECAIIKRYKLDKTENLNKMLSIHEENGFLDNVGLTETCILIRNHDNIKDFSNEWREMVQICIRDQMSFDYLLWKHRINHNKKPISERNKLMYKIRHKNPIKRSY